MKLPKRLPVGSVMYELRYARKGDLSEGIAGLCCPTRKLILIARGQSRYDLMHTLIHEVKHALQFESGLAQILGRQAMEMDAEGTAGLLTAIFNLSFKKAA